MLSRPKELAAVLHERCQGGADRRSARRS
jgi:hypothetical protein